jgi:hypothetical protein
MTKDDYLKKHIPHRINLLITFRERYSGLDLETRQKVGELARDFLRCSKDISMMMVRFLLGELGIRLQKNHNDISEQNNADYTKKLKVSDVICNPSYQNILAVLKAANRAIAHLEEIDVNHAIQTDPDDLILISAIDFTEQACIRNMYEFNSGFNYSDIMILDYNNMHRDNLKMTELIK